MARGSNPHKFTPEQRAKGLAAAAAKRKLQAEARREAKAAADAQAPETLEELKDRVEEAVQPQEKKGQTKEIAQTFSSFLILGSVLAAWGIQQPALAMTNVEAGAVAIPLANLFARSELNRTFGRYLVGSNDYVALGWALFQYGQRVATNWIHHDEIQPIRHTPETANGRVSADGTGPISSPKAGAHAPSPSDGLIIHRQAYGASWRDAN